jgi:hypothetical protein
LPASVFVLEVTGLTQNETIKVIGYQAMPADAENTYYSVTGDKPYWYDVYDPHKSFADDLKKQASAVGMLTSAQGSSYQGFKLWCCSGAVISTSPRILYMTNYHCGAAPEQAEFWTEAVCARTIVDLSWDGDSVSREFQCVDVVLPRRDLDLAVIELVPLVPGGPLPPNVPIKNSGPAKPGDAIHIIHHPQCLSKQMSKPCNVVETGLENWLGETGKTEFSHDCNTEGGSSGAPIFDANGAIVGLHHLPHRVTDGGMCERANRAVSVDEIVKALQNISPQPVLRFQ